MRGSARVGLGVLALLSAVVGAIFGVEVVGRSLGSQLDYLTRWGWAVPYLQIAAFALTAAIYFGLWRLAGARRGLGFLLGAFVCSLVPPATVLAIKLLPPTGAILEIPGSVFGFNGLLLVGALLFALGLLVSGLVPRWIGWFGIVGVAVHTPSMLYTSAATNQMLVFVYSANTPLSAVYQVVHLVFMVGLGVSLILGLSAGSPTSNKRIEQNANR